jgi:hypothetical protein
MKEIKPISTNFGSVQFSPKDGISGKICKRQTFSKFNGLKLFPYEVFPEIISFSRKLKNRQN